MHDLDQAEQWLEHSLELTPQHDDIGRADACISLGSVNYQRFVEAKAEGVPISELGELIARAAGGHEYGLKMLPPDHHRYRAAAYNQLGALFQELDDVPGALGYYQRALRHRESLGDTYGAGTTRFNIAVLLFYGDRASEALLYARAALTDFQQVGPGAAPVVSRAEALIRDSERRLAAAPS